jgi:hypothetical protein
VLFDAEILTQQRRIRRAIELLMTVIKYDGDPFVVGGRENLDEILVHVPHEPNLVTTFITTTVPLPKKRRKNSLLMHA